MHGLVLTSPGGRALTNAITWQDQRALHPQPNSRGTYFDALVRRVSVTEQQQLGNGLKPSLPLCALYWLAERKELPTVAAIPCSLPDYVLSVLGESEPVVEATMAAASGAYNLETAMWHMPMIERLGLTSLKWPRLVSATEPAYQVQVAGHVVPCFAPIGDHQCAVLGALLQDRELSLNISTGSQVSMLAPRWIPGEYEVRPYFDGRCINTITRIPAGRALNLLMDLLLELPRSAGLEVNDPWSLIGDAVAAVAQTDLQVDLSFFASAVGDQGAIGNIREDNFSVGHLFRAAFEAMAENYQTCAHRLSPAKAWRRLVFSGGLGQKFGVLREIIVARLGAEYRLCPSDEDTLLGLLVMALVADGRAQTVGQATEMVARRYAAQA